MRPGAETSGPGVPPDWETLLRFWFRDDPDDGRVARAQRPLWFGGEAAHDREVAARFGSWLDAAEAGGLESWATATRSRLALVILFDQISRVVGRGTPRAFRNDARALALAREMLDTDDERALRPIERAFLHLPLEHAEDLALQEECVARSEALARSVPAAWRDEFESFAEYARRHEVVIRRFGRFPHRNAILGRASSTDELAFLREPEAGF